MAEMLINKKNLKEIKRLREKAIEDKKDSFTFDGNEILVGYAKYLIEFMELKLNPNKK